MMSASVTEPTICWTSGEAARAASRRGSADSSCRGFFMASGETRARKTLASYRRDRSVSGTTLSKTQFSSV